MQKIEISGGYVELSEKIHRATAREYKRVLTQNSKDGSLDYMDAENAVEYLVLTLIERVVMMAADGTEHELKADQDWLDNLDENDFQKIGAAASKVYVASKEKAKK